MVSKLLLALSRTLALALLLHVGAAQAGEDEDMLVLGRISDNPKRHYEQLKPLLDYVVPRMADVGIREGRILMARDVQQMQSYLRRGRVDWVTETAAMASILQERAGARPLLATERDGVRLYRTVFFARRDSGIRTFGDLLGRSIAFQSPSSTSAYFAPAMALLQAGLPLEILLSPRDRPESGGVGYVFARSESNIAAWVHKRVVDAGAFSNLDWEDLERMPDRFREDLTIIGETEPYPRAVELVRTGLPVAVETRLREVLLAAADDPAGQEALRSFFQTNRFVEIDGDTAQALERVRAGVRRVRAELE